MFLFPFTLYGQETLTEEQLQEDFVIFKNVLTKGHPSLYEYTAKKEWENQFAKFEKELNQPQSDVNFFKILNSLANNAKDGHLRLFAPPTFNPSEFYFPLILKIIDGDFYTDTGDFDIPVGSNIVSVNGLTGQELINVMFKYAPSDGNNLTYRYREIELRFGLFYVYEFGITKEYVVEYAAPDGKTIKKTLPGENFEKIKLRNANRNSYFSNYHQSKDKFNHFKTFIGQNEPFVYYLDSSKTAVLTVNSFGLEIIPFKSKLIELFKEINSKKVENLIIDVRQNEGGFRPNAINLFSFITQSSFKQRNSESVNTLNIPEKAFVTRTVLDPTVFLVNRFKPYQKDGYWKIKEDGAENLMKPDKNRFKGKVFVLTGGKTFSAGAEFALNAKNDSQITLVGEETGGGYYFHTGEFPVYYKLPHSKIQIVMSMIKIEHYVKDSLVVQGNGILPDYAVNLTRQDLIEGKDAQLDFALEQIKNKAPLKIKKY